MNRPHLKPRLTAAALTLTVAPLFADGYGNAVLVDSPVAFYRLGKEFESPSPINSINGDPIGSHVGVTHGVPGIPTDKPNPSTHYDGGARTLIPNLPELNPPPTQSFTIEAWLRPTVEGSVTSGQAPLYNRKSDGNRQGWVIFQRGSVADDTNPDGQGFNFRMYNESGGSTSINLTGGNYTIGQWVHLAVTWDASQSRASLYINGNLVDDQVVATNPFVPNTGEPLSIGAYADGANRFTGDIDEVAFYPVALSGGVILNHASAPFEPSPQQDYAALVANDGAILHLRLAELDPGRVVAINQGTLGEAGNGLHFPGVTHSVPGALVGSDDTAIGYSMIDKSSNDGGYPTVLPNIPELNTASFSFEAWVKPTLPGNGNAQCLVANHNPGAERTGWVIWQRSPEQGWNLRAYNGIGNNATIDLTAAPYSVGEWQHLVVTFDESTQTAIIYSNGVEAGRQTATKGDFVPNPGTIVPGIAGFSNGWENPFEGSIDEVAFHDKPLDAARVLARYQNGTDPDRTTPYEDVVLSDEPVVYYRMNESSLTEVTNLGSAGSAAAGSYIHSPGKIDGPRPPDHSGFDEDSSASFFRGAFTSVDLHNPPQLNFAGPITLEAWIQPAEEQKNFSNVIIGHGGNDNFSQELYLRIENGKYEAGTATGKVSVDVPAEDFGTSGWVHLAATWSEGTWTLYRNGSVIGIGADATGPTPINNANWAIGARGRWKYGEIFPPADQHRVFHGGIATAAIYPSALSGERLAAHFEAGPGSSPLLSIQHEDGSVTLIWEGGTLEQSDDLQTWTPLPEATSPMTVPAEGKRFFRLTY